MNNQNELSFIKELKHKFLKHEIYSYISDVLVAVNPYKTMDELYTFDNIKMYQGESIGILPAHVFGLANEVKKNVGTPQSIIINGESGSGKTETSKILLKFFCGSKHAQAMINANLLLESFGNSRTRENANSSRFIKILQLKLDTTSIVTTELCTFSLESCRVCSGSSDIFHIFYYLACGAPSDLKEKLELENASFSILPRQFDNDEAQNRTNFEEVNQTLNSLGLTESEKTIIYVNLSAILHLGNVEFENTESEEAQVTELTKRNFDFAAKLLNKTTEALEKATLFRTYTVAGKVMWLHLSKFAASRARDTIAKIVYARLFQSIVFYINRAFANNYQTNQTDQNTNVTIIDIAGFECFTSSCNRFEQFCINYSNEKIQNFCTQRLICDELNWYKSQDIDVPEIPFPGNDVILDIFDNKIFGIFALLDEECRMPNPRTDAFMQKVRSRYGNYREFSSFHTNDEFVIRHFGQNVCYTPENFITNNAEVHSEHLCDLVDNISRPTCSTSQHSKTTNNKKKTYSATFRIELETLISKLKHSRSYFIRCVKPNRQKEPDIFDDAIVFNQLQSSGMLAYYNLMQLGFPVKIPIVDIFQKLKPYLEPRHVSIEVKNCCLIFLLSTGFQCKDFKFGKTEIHFRPGTSHMIDLMNVNFKQSDNQIAIKYKNYFKTFLRNRSWIAIRFATALMLSNRKRCDRDKQTCQSPEHPESVCEEPPKSEFTQHLRDALPKKNTGGEPTKTAYEKNPKLSIRFDGMNHLPEYDNHKDDERKGFRCKLDGCGKQTTVYCDKCKVHLCFLPGKSARHRNCFKKFHILKEN